MEKPFGYFRTRPNNYDDDDGFWTWLIMPKSWESACADSIANSGKFSNLWWSLWVFGLAALLIIHLLLCFFKTDLFNMSVISASVYFYIMGLIKMAF